MYAADRLGILAPMSRRERPGRGLLIRLASQVSSEHHHGGAGRRLTGVAIIENIKCAVSAFSSHESRPCSHILIN